MTHQDPFLSRPGDTPQTSPASSGYPQPGAPGLIPGAAAPAYGSAPQMHFDRSGVPVEKPTGLATGLIAVTGATTVLTLILAAMAAGDIDAQLRAAETGEVTFTGSDVLNLLTTPLAIAAFVLYGLWMTRMRRNREALGARPGMGAVEWWGWFVPLANAVLIPVGARKVTGRTVPLGLLLGWWLMWIAAQIAAVAGAVGMLLAFDFVTGELVRPEAIDTYPTAMWVSAALTLVSWGFLVMFIRAATERHLDPAA